MISLWEKLSYNAGANSNLYNLPQKGTEQYLRKLYLLLNFWPNYTILGIYPNIYLQHTKIYITSAKKILFMLNLHWKNIWNLHLQAQITKTTL